VLISTIIKAVDLKNIKITDNYLGDRIKLVTDQVIPYQWKALNDEIPGAPKSHSIENFRIAAGQTAGEFHGMPFQDSDLAKWIEAASYSLIHQPNKELEQKIDNVIDLISAAQLENGYMNTYFTVAKPDSKWTDFSHGHELYCAGHLIEAAVAYFEATGKKKFLDIMCRFVDHIDSIMGPEPHKRQVYCGHEEIELALIKLYKVTNERRYLKLCEYFINERGKQPCFLAEENGFALGANDRWFHLDYHQAHLPVREQVTAEGHSVRAMYLYCAMTDLAIETNDEQLKDVLKKLWDNVTNRRMYITGGIGSQGHGERFTLDYDLPNDVAYAETCASIGLIFWANRMLKMDPDGKYADILELALYNSVLSGMSLDGTKYFYVNPLEVFPETASYRHDHKHIAAQRVGWFGCACCPPNIARMLTSLGEYIYTQSNDGIQVQLYIGNESEFTIGGNKVKLSMNTNYPISGDVLIDMDVETSHTFSIGLRIPTWSSDFKVMLNGETITTGVKIVNGYLYINRQWDKGDQISLQFEMEAKKVRANPRVRENAGKIALKRGPIVFCLEEVDNGSWLTSLSIPKNAEITFKEKGGKPFIQVEATRLVEDSFYGNLYGSEEVEVEKVEAKAIPYSDWGNRTPGEMLVWIRES